MSFDAPSAPAPAAPVMPAAPPPVLAPQGAKPKKKSTTPTFLSASATPGGTGQPSGNLGGKTLLGA